MLISTNTGNSTLSGGAGDDTYLVYSLGDVVMDGVNQGNDILYTTVSYNLGENQVEAMSVADQMTTNAVNLIGNYVADHRRQLRRQRPERRHGRRRHAGRAVRQRHLRGGRRAG